MKHFYILNLDARRIALVAGVAFVVLALSLFIGMSIGKGQGERAARIASEERDAQKLGIGQETPRIGDAAADKLVVANGPTPAASITTAPAASAVSNEVPLQADPLIEGPPRKKSSAKKSTHKAAREDADTTQHARTRHRKKSAVKDDAEISGNVEHVRNRKTKFRRRQNDDERSENSPVAASGARYTIQVAAFKRSGDAQTLIGRLKDEGIKARSEKSGDFYLVTVGRSKSKEKLSKALTRLKELEYEAYIRKLRSPSDDI